MRVKNGAIVRVLKTTNALTGKISFSGEIHVIPSNVQLEELLALGLVEEIEPRYRTINNYTNNFIKEIKQEEEAVIQETDEITYLAENVLLKKTRKTYKKAGE